MTDIDMLQVLEMYEKHLKRKGVREIKAPLDKKPENQERMWAHLLSMISEIRQFIAAGKTEKAFHWLGFIRGVLWANQEFTIEELRHHNKP